MEKKRVIFVEFFIGLLLIATGLCLWWGSQQLVWILIFPPPVTKKLIEIIPFICWAIGILLILDTFRRTRKKID